MSGTISGGKKAAQSNIERHGKNYYSKIGRKGGKRSTAGGFASQKVGKDGLTGSERARLAGAKGGLKSKRKSKKKQLLHEWKRTKSISTAYDICDTFCEYYKIKEKEEE